MEAGRLPPGDPAGERGAVPRVPEVAEAQPSLVGGQHEPCLGRKRYPWMRVQHELEEGGAGPGAPEDEHGASAGFHAATLPSADETALGRR